MLQLNEAIIHRRRFDKDVLKDVNESNNIEKQ